MLMVYSLLPALQSPVHAEDFTAKHMGDYGNVSVMEVTGNYDANNSDGSVNTVPRQVIATEFFKTHKDDYDFLVIFSNFDFRMPEAEVKGFYLHIKNDILGIGKEVFDNSGMFGSSGRLQGTIDMGNIASKVTDPMDPGFEDTLGTLSHEMLHRWSAFVRFKDQSGSVSQALLGKGGAHWSFLLDSKGSLQYGNQWQDNKNGTYTSIAAGKYYSPLDLYLMGMLDKSKVPPMLLIENPAIDPQKMPEVGATISGTSRMVTIDDIIAAEGERVPSALDSRKSFKTAFIFVTTPGTFTGKELTGIENVRNGFVTRYSILTDGKGLVQVASTPKDNLPLNGGGTLPVLIPRTLPPDINEGITWLIGRQQADGSWSDIPLTTERDTSEAVFTLQSFPAFAAHYQSGLQWLGRVVSNNTDFLARRIDSLLNAGGDASPLITSLASLQNPDGGWGSARNFISSASDTALALKALVRAGYADRQAIGRGVSFLKSQKNGDGGWGDSGAVSALQPTAAAIGVLTILKNEFGLDSEIQNALTWLKQKQNPDGGFGASPSTVHETALAVMALRETGAESAITTKGVTFLLGQQSENGSWGDSPFQTALVVRSVWQATITADLSIKNSDITFIPERVSQLPTTAVVSAVISNLGRTDVPQAKVVLYDGAVAPDRKVGEQTLAFPSASAVTVTFSVPIPDGNSHTFHLAVDPDNLVKESDKTNNTAVKTLLPELTYDFAVNQGDLTLSINPVDIFKDVKLTARVANKGTSNAYNVQLRFFIDEPGAPFEIATITTDIPAGGAVTKEITWKAAKAGTDMPLTLQVDPQNTFTELSESNNRTTLPLTVTGATLPNLSVSHKDMVVTPNPAMERGATNISIQVKNNGFSPAENVKVNFYNGVPGSGGVLIGSETIPVLAAGQSRQVSVTWGPITESGTRILFISVDPDNTVAEIAEDDNSAFTELEIKSLPDLTISTNSIALNPSAPKEGDTLAINVTVQNSGSQDALNVPVLVKEGSTLIGTQVIARIAGHGQASASLPYSTIGKNGTHELQVSVDAENVITELSEDNNTATKTFSVQNANLWVSEQYISPNGDGVKDTTDFFFRLAASTKVQVQVVNRKGNKVRTFTGGELDNTAGMTVTWDGKGDSGTVVNDGEYQMKVVGADSRILGTLQVVVDTNRSSLVDAIGTKYLLKKPIVALETDMSWNWLQDESGIIVNLWSGNKLGYPHGLYLMSPLGDELAPLPCPACSNGGASSCEAAASPGSTKLLLSRYCGSQEPDAAWILDLMDNSMIQLESGKLADFANWSPDSRYLFYRTRSHDNTPERNVVASADGQKLFEKADDNSFWHSWSPDSNKLLSSEFNPTSKVYELKVTNLEGQTTIITSSSSYISPTWIDSSTIVSLIDNKVWLHAVSGLNNRVIFSGYAKTGNISVSPDKKRFVFTSTSSECDKSTLIMSDIQGNINEIYEVTSDNLDNDVTITNMRWSHDANKILFVENHCDGNTYYSNNCPGYTGSYVYRPIYVVTDLQKNQYKQIANVEHVGKYSYISELAWLPNDNAFYTAGWFNGAAIVGLEDDKVIEIPSWETWLSPAGRYVYYNYFTNCIDRGGYYSCDIVFDSMSSLLNLTADLRISKSKSVLTLKGTAADKNYEGYKLEYADINNPGIWNLIAPPSEVPVVDDVFTTWAPPNEGTFYSRLTVWDKAGNTATTKKRVGWGLSSSISNLYKSLENFSPNGDGVKDTVELHFQVLEPVHLEFFVHDDTGGLVRTVRRDYAQSTADSISWDGKDESGKVVPDGKYSIKIFDYEFFVEVDSAFPDTGVGVGPIVRDIKEQPSMRFTVTIGGHATDKNLKKWSISSGDGDNPQEWGEFMTSATPLFTTNNGGKTTDTDIRSYEISLSRANNGYEISSNTIEWLVGKTYRIDAEDFAGNKKTSISNRLDEMMSLLLWDGFSLVEDISGNTVFIPASLMRSGIHHLKGFETVRNTFTRLNLQYAVYDVTERKEKWSDDTSVGGSDGGIITLDWDRSPIGSDISAVRLKGTDLSGKEYYSKRYPTEEVFKVLCNGRADNTLFGKLATLEFQLQSSDDGRYANWTSVKVYDSSKGDVVPEGPFTVPLQPGQILDGKKYYLRMIGIETNGTHHESTTGLGCEDTKQTSFTLKVAYPAGECGTVQSKAELSLIIENFSGLMKSVEYYLQKPGELQLIQRNDLTREGIGTVPFETTGLAEGSYPVKAVLRYIDLTDNSEKTVDVSNTLVVDRVPPEARITYPAGSGLMLCPVQTNEPEGPWFGIPPEGVVQDNIAVKDYELYYGVGESPSKWIAATTKVRDQGLLLNQPLTGKGALKGTIGKWDVTDMRGGETYAFRLKVTDAVGNVSCGTSSPFTFDNAIEIPALSLDKALFSPNGDSVLSLVNGMYTINENARVDAKTFKVIENSNTLILDATPVKTLISGKQHLSGTEYIAWDGSSDTGGTVPDGRYGLAVFAADSCGNVNRRWVPMEVDNTPPTSILDYPKPVDPLPPGNIIEVKGRAHDLHFTSYTLEAGEGSNPDTWRAISSGKTQMVATPGGSPILGQWNTYGQTGVWTLRLSALDAAGNKNSVLSTVDLGERKTLVKDLKASPLLSSPNNDGKLDSSAISYEVTDACDIRIEFLDSNDAVVRTSLTTTRAAGVGGYVWDGKDGTGAFVKDGDYKVRLTATLTANPSVNQTEVITLTTDATPPAIDLKQPAENTYLDKKEITLFGTVNDPHLVSYAVNVTGPDGSFALDAGTQSKDSHAFGVIPDLKEDRYTLNIDAKDQGENTSRLTRIFFIDRTLPKATLDTPKSGQYFGSTGNVIDITGAIVEKNLARYTLRYGSGETPTEWKDVVGGDTIPTTAKLHSWKVGKDDGVPDGEYTLSLYAKDKAGLEGEARVRIIIDNTLPVATVSSPADGASIKGAFDIRGTASDVNFDKGRLELSEGACPSAEKWVSVKTTTSAVTDGIIASFKELPVDGPYCLRLTATDKVGNKAESRMNISIDTKPPASPRLTRNATETRTSVSLTWTKNSEPDLAGYNLYRDNVKLNQVVLTGDAYLDEGLKEGAYSYTVKAVDLGGNESEPSNAVKFAVDTTGPTVRISSPSGGSRVGSLVDIRGNAYSADDFKEYRVSIGKGAVPSSWSVIRTSPVPVSYGSLAEWDTIAIADGETYTIQLEGEDLSGNISTSLVSVTIDNTAPAKPALLSATPTGANVALTWRANSESDLAGYLLFRNDHLANATGVVAGNLKPYYLSGTSYADKSLPDGKHAYSLVAMDQAGNSSEQSNTIEVELENRRPHAVISQPTTGTRLEQKTLVRADSPDTDIVSVQFQYKKVQDSVWTSLGSPVTGSSFVTHFDPKTLGLAYGEYHLMATASDKVGPDPAPTPVTVTYTDLTTTATPSDLKAQTSGKNVTLTWTANAEADLDGYTVYRSVGTTRTKVNASLLKTPTYLDENLVDNDYTYEISATDTHGNESKASGIATAKVYAPVLLQPYTPLGKPNLKIEGKNAVATASVELLLDNASGQTSAGKVTADPQGVFALENMGLTLGENRISATATDAANNASRPSDTIVVVYNETPSAPVNLIADVQDHTVNLGWDATNTDPDVIGYNIFRDGVKLNLSGAASGGTAAASSVATDWSSYPYKPYSPSLALDGDSTTSWRSEVQESGDTWWEVDFPQPELLNHLEIHWGTEEDGTGKEIVYGGKDFQVQAWSGYAWIPLTKVSGNDGRDNGFDFKPSYRTDRVRIHVTAAMSDHIRIAEVGVTKDNLVATNAFQDSAAKDKQYGYKVTAVDKYGFESPPSEEKAVVVGDIIPPADPRSLTATASGSDITLDWSLTPNTEPDLAGYLVYRNSNQGWTRVTPTPVSGASYQDAPLTNGSYTYRITAVDNLGNESGPSNEATASVAIGLQVAPVITRAQALPRGNVNITWTCAAASIEGYTIHRSTTSGGPYVKLNTQLLYAAFYTDSGVTSGTTYYYVVRVVDAVGNESPNSNEVSVTVLDSEAPNKPVIVSPTVPGTALSLRKDSVDVACTADANTTIELYRNGVSVGTTGTAEPQAIKNMPLKIFSIDSSLSPDRTTLLYSDWSEIWRLTLATGQSERIVAQGHSPFWLADGKRFGYLSYDNYNNYRVGIYDISTGSSQFATDDEKGYEEYPSWTAEGDKVAFQRTIGGVSSIWIKDFVSGELSQVPSNSTIFSLSPDGSRLAYFDNLSLSVLDLAKGTVTPVSNATDGYYIVWSPDNTKLLYAFWENDMYAVSVFDTVAQTTLQVVDADFAYLYELSWSPDSNRIVYARENSDVSSSLHVTDLQGATKHLADTIVEIYDIEWVDRESFIYISQDNLNSIALQPQYRFTDVALESGENRMYVTSADAAGNTSPRSDEITVIYDTSNLPDISISAQDILIYPPNPKPGTEVLAKAVVRNPSTVDVENVAVELHLWDQAGELKLLKSDVITRLAAGSDGSTEVRFTAGTTPGSNTLIVVADPRDLVKELSESNNNATAEFYVTDKEELLMTTVVAQSRYTGGRDVVIGVDLRNSGPAAEGKLEVLVEDEAGVKVAQVESKDLALAYGAKQTLNYTWNTGATFAGAYQIHTVLKGTTGILAENRTPFAIVADMTLDARVVTDKAFYGPQENVLVTAHLKNTGTNGVIQKLVVKTKIINSLNEELSGNSREILNLLPGADASLSATWNTGLTVPGGYRAQVQVYLGDSLFTTAETAFTIAADAGVSGTVTAEPAVVAVGNTVKATATITNSGNTDASGVLKVSLTDPDTQAVMESYEQTYALAKNISQTGEFTFQTGVLALKTYAVTLQQKTGETLKTLASTSITVKDVTPPSVIILSPEQGSAQQGTIKVQALVYDDASGVEKAEYRIDAGAWKLLPAADAARGKYLIAWEPSLADTGQHTISCRAYDKKGNESTSASTSFTVQLDSIPPVLTVSTLSNGARTNQETLNIAGVVHDDSGVRDLSINGEYIPIDSDGGFTHAILLVEGENRITTLAYDLAGNRSEDTRIITLDLNVPNLVVTTPSDNLRTGEQLVTVSGAVNENCTVDVKVNGTSAYSGIFDSGFTTSVLLLTGLNHIEITATDLAGNTSSIKRTVYYDNQKPTLVITEPGQDISTNKSSLTIRGNVGDNAAIPSVTMTFDGTTYTPAVVNGVFQQAVSFTEEKLYEVVITATDGIIGHEVSTQRNVIYDITKPVLTIDPVLSPVSETSQVISGTREERALVTVSCPTATVGEISYPTATTWRVSLTNLRAGENGITATSSDSAGNQATAPASIFVQVDDNDLVLIPFPSVLWPPNHKKIPVLIAGWVRRPCHSDIESVVISVADEYGKYNYTNLHFGSVIRLEAWREGNDKDGRIYTVTAVATHRDGRKTTTVRRVIVPHDLSKCDHEWDVH
jgi:subtilase family serine protease/fibronectin type 3 domain-containing protein